MKHTYISQINQALNEVPKDPKYFKKVNKEYYQFPSKENVKTILEKAKQILFPEYLADKSCNLDQILKEVEEQLSEEIYKGLCFDCRVESLKKQCSECQDRSKALAEQFLHKLHLIKTELLEDIKASYLGDPAATSCEEVILSYPGVLAIFYYRVAHNLLKLNVPILPRIIAELAHSMTGIDIHPGAQISKGFFIDHGTGIVIGETTVIGQNVKIYQGVTLGAKSFSLDSKGHPIKGVNRHPLVEDDVTIYAGATILGPVTIGRNSTIGGNVWITEDVVPNSQITQQKSNITERPKVHSNISKLIFNTPIVSLSKVGQNLKANIFAKLESFNPGGSVKDRMAQNMMARAYQEGKLKAGDTIVEATSGNTGIALAYLAAQRGYKLILTMPETMTIERRKILAAFGAELLLTPGEKGMKGALERALQIVAENENFITLSQFENPANPDIHRKTTAPEILRDMDGQIDIFVAGVGTGGTFTGVSDVLKKHNSKIHCVAVEPKGSPFLSSGKAGPHKIQGIGAGFIPKVLNTKLIDQVITVGMRRPKKQCFN